MDQEQQSPSTVPQMPRAQSTLGVPIAIVIASLVIGGAILFTGRDSGNSIKQPSGNNNEQVTKEIEVTPVTSADHIRGNPNAPIVIVEYSDYDCPFCKNFHETMNRIMIDYGESGKVAWVYRHFPLEQLHPNARLIAEASECVADLGDNTAFWKFSDLVFGERAQNAATDMTKLADYAKQSGVDQKKFNECYTSGKMKEKVQTAIQDAMKAGAQGTPHSIMIVGDQKGTINGAQPYETVRNMVETMLEQIGAAQ